MKTCRLLCALQTASRGTCPSARRAAKRLGQRALKWAGPLLAAFFAPAALAGVWSFAPWSSDASSGLNTNQTLWAYNFSTASNATVNGVAVIPTGAGVVNPSVAGRFAISGVGSSFASDSNNLTSLGGNGSAVLARDFISGGNPANVTIQGLTVGQFYTVTFFSVGFDTPGVRLLTFASGADTLLADQGAYGNDNGIRIQYGFVAGATNQSITITPNNAGFTFHLYALALNSSTVPPVLGGAISLNGASQHAVVPSGVWFSNQFTVEAWVNVRSYANWSRLMEFGNGPSINNVLFALSQGTSGQPIFQIYNGSGGLIANVLSPVTLPLNQWTHLAFTFDGAVGSILINGSPVASSAMAVPVNVTRTNNYLGRSLYGADAYANASFDEFRIWSASRTPAQIQASLARPLTGNEAGLVLCYRLDEATGTNVINSASAVAPTGNATLVSSPQWTNSGVRTVLNTNDAGLGSLRGTLTNVAPGDFISFATNLSGQGITLTNGQIVLDKNLVLDASVLPAGITINGNHNGRIFNVPAGVTNVLNALTLTNGYGTGGNYGGAITVGGSLTLMNCTLAGNAVTGTAGAIFCDYGSALTMVQCTLTANTAANAGAIGSYGALTILQCTLAGNSAGNGGGIYNLGTLALTNSIVAGNTPNNFAGGLPAGGNNLTNAAPMLAVLGNYGGPTPTMPPMAGSPALDGCTNGTGFATDQRGLPRVVGPFADLGAAEFQAIAVVTTTADSGAGSLRYAITYATNGAAVIFATNLSGTTILLTNGELLLNKSLTLDASALPLGLQLNGNHANRIFNVAGGATVVLDSLTLTNGFNTYGAAIINAGNLTVRRCTMAGNSASSEGGGIYSSGPLTVSSCSFVSNTAYEGGGVRSVDSPVTIDNSTFATNLTTVGGGVSIAGSGAATFRHLTVIGNSATGNGGCCAGGGIFSYNRPATLVNSVIFGNSAPVGPDVQFVGGGLTNVGVNFVSNPSDAGLSAGPAFLVGNPLLSALGKFGGPTPTCVPLTGSPLIDAGSDSVTNTLATDQRGFARKSGPRVDVGAVEANVLVVTNGTDSGPGSLRDRIAQAAANEIVSFDPSFSGQTMVLSGGAIYIDKSITIDGSSLPGGIRLDGNGMDRIFWINSGATVVLTALTITNGNGGIYYGGGVLNFGSLTLNRCTLAGNTAYIGGAAFNWDQALVLNQCTLVGNTSGDSGGALFNYVGTMAAQQCTVARNSASNSIFGGGGGLMSYAGPLTMNNSIVANNSGPLNPDLGFLSLSGANNFTNGNPLLAPLGNYGGPTPTMPPQPGSPVIDASGALLFSIDQRGAARPLGAAIDIGAVEVNLVTTTADNGPGSLRSAVTSAIPNDFINFAPALAGATILLTNGHVLLDRSLTLDASALAGGVTVNGGTNGRIFLINSGVSVTLDSLTLTNGKVAGNGGAIANSGTLALNRCTLTRNSAGGVGGAIQNGGTLSANNCTFASNTAPNNGGAVANDAGAAGFTNCTFFGNAQTGPNQGGGAINHAGGAVSMTLVHCTISGNSSSGNQGGGGIRNRGPLFTLANSIVAANTISAGTGADVNNNSTITLLGANVLAAFTNASPGAFTGTGSNIIAAPVLAAPGNFGGPTLTMPPLPGSPAIDAGGDTLAATLVTDQRGLSRFVGPHVDIGAVEAARTNDLYSSSIVLSGTSLTITSANLNATSDAGEPEHAGNAGGKSLWWIWTPVADGAVIIDTIGSTLDTLLAVYTGNSIGALAQVAANDDIGDGSSQSRVQFNVTAGVSYHIVVDGYNAGAGAASGTIVLHLQQSFGSVFGAANGITTLAGRPDTGSADGPGALAVFNNPFGIVLDRGGNAYVADQLNHTIRKVSPVGVVTTIAGVAGQYNLADGVGGNARFFGPGFIAMDSATNLYVTDIGNHSIRKLSPSGTNWIVTTLAGRPWPYPVGNVDGTNFDARFEDPQGIALDVAGNLFVADAATHTIRKLTRSGTDWIVTTIAGLAYQIGNVDGTGTNARFNGPLGLTLDSIGNIYVTERDGFVVRKLTPSGPNWTVSTIAGAGFWGSADGTNTSARFGRLFGITADSRGNLFVADEGNKLIRKLTPVGLDWVVTTFAGGDPNRYASADGTGDHAWFNSLNGLAFDVAGNLYVTDKNAIRKITTAAVATTLAGVVIGSTSDDDTGPYAGFYRPYGVAAELSGNNIYVTDSENHTIRKITSVGGVSTISGLVGNAGFADGAGDNARFSTPYGIVVDGAGNLFVGDSGNNRIRKITSAGVVSTWAGAGVWGLANGPALSAQFRSPSGLALDGSGNLFVADTWNHAIRKISASGNVSTIAGTGVSGTNDGPGASAQFYLPTALALDKAGNIFVADTDNHTIRKLTPAGVNWTVTTIAGVAGEWGQDDGTGAAARFRLPSGIAIDGAGRVYVADRVTSTIRQLTLEGTNWVVRRLAGDFYNAGFADGIGLSAQFNYPRGLALDGVGALYIADTDNNLIRKGIFSAYAPSRAVVYTPPPATGRITVTLQPPEANGQWRFPWELGWHASGATVSNLAAGNYPIEFRNVSGWVVLPLGGAVTLSSGATLAVTNTYYPSVDGGDPGAAPGTLTVFLGPTPPAGAGWRFLGDNTAFYPNAFTTNLVAGTYFIEFAAVSGRIKPASQAVQITAGQPSYLSVNYLLAATPPSGVALPVRVPAGLVNDEFTYPFGFNGQLQSENGFGSGVAVQNNVVLTAAHLIFNDQTLSYVTRAHWFFRRDVGVADPLPIEARGFNVLSGYAAQRTNDLASGYSPDESTPPSRNLDVAALYFLTPVAGGGYGGYLPSDTVPNNWLSSPALKMLVGYPVDGSQFGDASIVPGKMYQTQPQPFALSLASDPVPGQQQVYTAPWFLSYPGNSGGPLYVQLNGYYYPAAVYLGTLFSGSQPYASVVRAIDSSVANLITLASAQGDSGTNFTGGGVITIVPSQKVSAANPGYVQFRLAPPAAVRAGAAWRLQGDTAYSTATNYTRAVTSTNAFAVEFKPVPGWNLPVNQSVLVSPGVLVTNTAFYTVVSPLLMSRPAGFGVTGTTGTVYRLERSVAPAGAPWLPVSTNTITTTGFNLVLPRPATNPPSSFYRLLWLP